MTIFITGGCKNGKSTFALRQAMRLGSEKRCYVATMLPKDEEELRCIARHREARAGMNFITSEQPYAPTECFGEVGSRGVFLLDSVTALLSNVMFTPDGEVHLDAAAKLIDELGTFLDTAEHAVVVSDYIYCDGAEFSELTEEYRSGLAQLDIMLAQRCDVVAEICSGIPTIHKGELPWSL